MGDEERPFDPFERNAEAFGLRWQDVTVKKYRRSAAGQGQTPPKRLRTDATLHRTVQYLLDRVVDADVSPSARLRANFASGGPDALDVWLYVWDRMRAVRVDYAEQRFGSGELLEGGGRCSASCVAAFEKMARFHIVTHHELLGFVSSGGGGAAPKAFATYLKHSADAVTATLATLWALYRELLWSHVLVGEGREDATNTNAASPPSPPPPPPPPRHAAAAAAAADSLPPFLRRGLGLLVLWNMNTSGGLWLQGFLADLARFDRKRTAALEAATDDNDGGAPSHAGGLLRSRPVAFALAVVAARRRRDFAAFFRLLREAPYVEACAMAPFAIGLHSTWHATASQSRGHTGQGMVGQGGGGSPGGGGQLSDEGSMRGCAVRALQKALAPGRGVPAKVCLSDLTSLLCADDDRATAALLRDHGVECHCGGTFSGKCGGGGGGGGPAHSEGVSTAVATAAAAAPQRQEEAAPPAALFVKAAKGAPESFVPRPYAAMSAADAASRVRPLAVVLEKRAGRSRREICTAAGTTSGDDDDDDDDDDARQQEEAATTAEMAATQQEQRSVGAVLEGPA